MNVLGLSFDYHDSAAALVLDGVVAAAAQEERYSRVKHDSSFPGNAIKACLAEAGLRARDIDHVVFYEQPMLKFDRIVYGALHDWRHSAEYIDDTLRSWFRRGKFDPCARISEQLGVSSEQIHLVTHHQSHAASAFYCSGFDRATVVTLDGVGEYETASISIGKNRSIQQLSSVRYPHSIGLLYSAFTAFLGFEVNEGEYKVMGMAGFGKPAYADKIRSLVRMQGEHFSIDQRYFSNFAPGAEPYTAKLLDMFGAPRKPEAPFDCGDSGAPARDSIQEASRHYADIAASVQRVTEELILSYVGAAVERTGARQVAMAGGVALNSLANGRLKRELGADLYVQPAAGDAGGALGAALHFYHDVAGLGPPRPLTNVLLGSGYADAQIAAALDEAGLRSWTVAPSDGALCEEVARLLEANAVIGWFQGRFEWGPRALGSRSILGNPTNREMQRIINEKIKFREPFRPFAPAVLAERAHEYFEVDEPHSLTQPENFMLSVCRVRASMRDRIPAVTHVDGTARVQFVSSAQGTAFRRLIEAFDRLTGVPVLLNTSFNRRGEPIVASPADAIKTFSWSGLDYLVMNNYIVNKSIEI